MDITSLVALPVWIMMPFSMLQNISEIMEYTDRLEKAAKTEDPYERSAAIAAFYDCHCCILCTWQSCTFYSHSLQFVFSAKCCKCTLHAHNIKVNDSDDGVFLLSRLAWVVGFTMGPFPGNERTWKPFNPILGETFELSMNNGLRFIAEQVQMPSIGKLVSRLHLWMHTL